MSYPVGVQTLPLVLFASSVTLCLAVKTYMGKDTSKSSEKENNVKTYKIVALDLDGTTLNTDHALTTPTTETLQRLSAKGIQICIATGRSLGAVKNTLNELKLGVEVPVVCLNGAMGINMAKDVNSYETVFDSFVPPVSATKLLDFAAKQGLVAQYYIDSEVYAAPKTEEHKVLLGRYSVLTGRKQQIVNDYSGPVGNAAAAKILLMTADADGLIEEAVKYGFDNEFHMIKGSPEPFFVEFLAPGINKGSGLQRMCDEMKFNIEDVVAFGDGENDKEFLQFAGLGVAMKNARPLAMAAADVVNPWTNDEDGVAQYLREMETKNLLHPLL
jgi:Cof subfamily protein (haloacid dehalogenase superfamily)